MLIYQSVSKADYRIIRPHFCKKHTHNAHTDNRNLKYHIQNSYNIIA